MLCMLGKTSADDILKYFSQNVGFDISCRLSPQETICLKCQNLFSGENKKKHFNMSSAENSTQPAKR